VRRYTIDSGAIRNAIRVLQHGHILGIFPEGERSWDGTLLPFKRGTMRLVLAMGVPILPVGISGAYALMPRWTSSICRVKVTIRFGEPVYLNPVPIDLQSDTNIKETSELLKSKIKALIQENRYLT
jgi:1-acyl-sn-glycerol-3-phosphate acyltransferase